MIDFDPAAWPDTRSPIVPTLNNYKMMDQKQRELLLFYHV
jgi:hypothetical protein